MKLPWKKENEAEAIAKLEARGRAIETEVVRLTTEAEVAQERIAEALGDDPLADVDDLAEDASKAWLDAAKATELGAAILKAATVKRALLAENIEEARLAGIEAENGKVARAQAARIARFQGLLRELLPLYAEGTLGNHAYVGSGPGPRVLFDAQAAVFAVAEEVIGGPCVWSDLSIPTPLTTPSPLTWPL